MRMKRPENGSYRTCGYRRAKPAVLPTIALMFMYVAVPPERGEISRALFAASTMLLGPTAMLGSAGVVTAEFPVPAAVIEAFSLSPCWLCNSNGDVPAVTAALSACA